MATDAGNIVVTLTAETDKLKKGMKDAQDSVSGFSESATSSMGAYVAGIAAAGAAVLAFAVSSLKQYGEQEQAVSHLTQALKNMGVQSQSTVNNLTEFAAALQKVTAYSDDQIISVEATLTAFGLQGEQLKKVTRSTLDLAAAKGIDLQSASQLLGKAFVGETGTLARYGIVIDQSGDKTEKFALAMTKLNQMFGGQAEAQRKTLLGQYDALVHEFEDLMKVIGGLLAGPAIKLMQFLSTMIQSVTDLITGWRGWGVELRLFATQYLDQAFTILKAFYDLIGKFMQAHPQVVSMMQTAGINIKAVRTALGETALTLGTVSKNWKQQATDATVANKKILNTTLVTGAGIREDEEFTKSVNVDASNTMLAIYAKNAKERTDAEIKFVKEFRTSTTEWVNLGTSLVGNFFDSFSHGFAEMIVDGKKFSDIMKSIWQDLAREIIAAIARMIIKWLAFLALRGVLTAFGGGAGAALGGIIASQASGAAATGGMINEPSVLTGLKSGKTILAGEAGPEAIVPMGGSANKTASEMGTSFAGGGGGGGGDIHVHIQGQFMEGNESMWRQMFRDKILPEVRRATMSNPTGNFNRKRGATA